ncbi:hypothetical protein Ancab_038108 [Ancistrocladus abbreviatus]
MKIESTSRSGKVWSLSLGNGPTFLHSWMITTAFIFVLVAIVLSTYLIFEHLAAYNRPESLCRRVNIPSFCQFGIWN